MKARVVLDVLLDQRSCLNLGERRIDYVVVYARLDDAYFCLTSRQSSEESL
jgi:hypothetical protein